MHSRSLHLDTRRGVAREFLYQHVKAPASELVTRYKVPREKRHATSGVGFTIAAVGVVMRDVVRIACFEDYFIGPGTPSMA